MSSGRWAEQLENKGREEGRLQGRAEQLLRQIRLKFGEPPEAVLSRVEAATAEQLDRWAERILTADTLEDLLA